MPENARFFLAIWMHYFTKQTRSTTAELTGKTRQDNAYSAKAKNEILDSISSYKYKFSDFALVVS